MAVLVHLADIKIKIIIDFLSLYKDLVLEIDSIIRCVKKRKGTVKKVNVRNFCENKR